MDYQKYLENLPEIEALQGKLEDINAASVDDRKRVEAAFEGYKAGEISFAQLQEVFAEVITPEFFERVDRMYKTVQEQRDLMGLS